MADERVGLELVLADKDFIRGVNSYLSSLREMNSATSRASSDISSSGVEISKSMAAMTGAIVGATAAATVSVINMVAAVVSEVGKLLGTIAGAIKDFAVMGIKTNATLEQLQIKLETVTGAGAEMLTWVREVSKATPFTANQLGDVIAMAAAYGFSAEEAKKLALTAGDVSAAMGGGAETMNRIIRALGQMQARTKVAGGEMLQLTEAGIPAWQILADKMGISVSELQDLVQKGLVPASEAIPVLTDALNNKFGGAMEAQSQTAKGLFDTLTETIQLAAADITAPLFEEMKGLLLDVTGIMDGLDIAAITAVVQDFADALMGAFNALKEGEFATVLLPAIGDALSEVFGMGDVPDFSFIGELASFLNDVSTPLAEFIGLLAGGDMAGVFGMLAGGNEDLIALFAGIGTAIVVAQATINSFIVTLQSTLGPTFSGIIDQLTGILNDFGADWGDVWEAVKMAIGIVAAVIGAILVGLVGVVVGVVSGIAKAVEQIVIAWRAVLPHIITAIGGLMKVFMGLYTFFVKLFEGDFPGAFNALKVAFTGVADFISGTIMALWEGIKGTFNMILGFFSGFVDGIIQFSENLYNSLVGHSIFIDLLDGIVGVFTDIQSLGLELMSGLVNGIIDIVTGMVTNVISSVGEIAGALANALTGGGKDANTAPAGQTGGAAPTPGTGGPGFDELSAQLVAIQAQFNEFILGINTQMTLLVEGMTLGFMTMNEAVILPFLTSLMNMSLYIAIAVSDIEKIGKTAVGLSAAFSTFSYESILSVTNVITAIRAQFEGFSLFLEELKGRLAKHWLDFTMAMQALTSDALNNITGAFTLFLNNFGGDMATFTDGFDAAAADIISNIDNSLSPALEGSGGAFKALAHAAKAAANDVAAACADICDAVTSAHECATGSPELIIQHPFEDFKAYLKKNTPAMAALIEEITNPMDKISSQALNLGRGLDNTLGRSNARIQAGVSQGSQSVVNNVEYNLGPVYQREQSPASMLDDLALMNLLS